MQKNSKRNKKMKYTFTADMLMETDITVKKYANCKVAIKERLFIIMTSKIYASFDMLGIKSERLSYESVSVNYSEEGSKYISDAVIEFSLYLEPKDAVRFMILTTAWNHTGAVLGHAYKTSTELRKMTDQKANTIEIEVGEDPTEVRYFVEGKQFDIDANDPQTLLPVLVELGGVA